MTINVRDSQTGLSIPVKSTADGLDQVPHHIVDSVPDGGQVTIGAKADSAQTDPTQSASLIALVKGLFTGITIKAGAALIGKVGIDQTTPGTTNAVIETGNLKTPGQALRLSTEGTGLTYSTGILNFTPAATPTDIFGLGMLTYANSVSLKRIMISGSASSAAVIDVLLQRSLTGGAGTSTNTVMGKHDTRDTTGSGYGFYYTANRTSNGNGVSSSRPIIRSGKLTFGTSTAAGAPLVWTFGDRGAKPLMLKDLSEWIVVNLNGQTMPAGAAISIDVELSEERVVRVGFCGDSTYSTATTLFSTLGAGGMLNSFTSIDNLGSNVRLTDFLNNTGSPAFPLTALGGRINDVVVLGYGLNDVRIGATSQAALQTLIDSTIASIVTAYPDCKIILHGPNSLTTDDPGVTGLVTSTGLFTGMSLAVAAQTATDIVYNAYQAFANDARIFALVQRQTVTGRTCVTNAASGLMTDILNPNARGQTLIARQIYPTIISATKALYTKGIAI